jgi:hypothetical protein
MSALLGMMSLKPSFTRRTTKDRIVIRFKMLQSTYFAPELGSNPLELAGREQFRTV